MQWLCELHYVARCCGDSQIMEELELAGDWIMNLVL